MTENYEPTASEIQQLGNLLNTGKYLIAQYETGLTVLPIEYYSLLRAMKQLDIYFKQVAVRLYADVAELNPDFLNYVSDH